MKIADIKHAVSETQDKFTVAQKHAVSDSGMSFSRQMTTLHETAYQHYINDLQERIHRQGEKLKEKADIKAFQEYRQLISELLGEAASNAYACIKSSQFDAKGRHKVLFVIRSVNQKLEEMASAILSDQQDNIRLLQMLDDIRGMLVDLFM